MKETVFNSGAIVLYFLVLLALLFNVSGGDIALLLFFGGIAIIHFIIVLVIAIKVGNYNAMKGFLLGLIICIGLFFLVNHFKERQKPGVQIGYSK